MAAIKPKVPHGMSKLKREKKCNKTKYQKQAMPYDGPRCFIIPGNHGWIKILICSVSAVFVSLSDHFKSLKVGCCLECHFCTIMSTFCVTDWFDGLHTFMRNICYKSWLGGWFMPQKKSYFALKLPKGWWVFGLDLALDADIDRDQFNFFSQLARDKVFNLSHFLQLSGLMMTLIILGN